MQRWGTNEKWANNKTLVPKLDLILTIETALTKNWDDIVLSRLTVLFSKIKLSVQKDNNELCLALNLL